MPSDSEPITKRQEWLLENIFPCREVHLIAGPSGAGKTTWLLQFIQQWKEGKPIFDCRSFPLPFVYVSGDRSLESLGRTFVRVGMSLDSIPNMSLIGVKDRSNPRIAMQTIMSRFPEAKVIFLEGMGGMVPKGANNDYNIVAEFLTTFTSYCQDNDRTIIGVLHSNKAKENESYRNPRQRIHGSVAWAAYSETVILVEPEEADNSNNPRRNLFILPRNSAEEKQVMSFNADGRLDILEIKDTTETAFLQYLIQLPIGHEYKTSEILARFGSDNVSRRSMERWIRRAEIGGVLMKCQHGRYARIASA